MDCFETYYFLNQKLLKIIGLWPKEKIEINFRICSIAFIIATAMIHQFDQLLKSDSMDSIIQSLYFVIPDTCITLAYITVLWEYPKMSQIVYCLRYTWKNFVNEQEVVIMKQYANESKRYTIFISGFLCSFTILATIPPVFSIFTYYFSNKNDTVLRLIMPADRYTVPNMTYYMLLIQQFLATSIYATIASTVFSSLFLIVQHVCAILDVLVVKINEPFKKDRDKVWLYDEVKESYHWFVDISRCYEEAVKLVDLLNAVTENTYLVEMLLGTILFLIIFLYMFQIPTLLNDIIGASSMISYMVTCTLIFYINSAVGQKLLDHSSQVLENICHVPFYDVHSSCHKPLLLLMIRSMKPCKLSVGGIFAISHSFFSELMQKSYSYAMVCYTMR